MHKLQNRTSYSSIDNEWVPGEVVEGVEVGQNGAGGGAQPANLT